MYANRLFLSNPQFADCLERLPAAALLCAGGLLFGVMLAGTQAIEGSAGAERAAAPAPAASSSRPAKPELRAREGSEIVSQPGAFSSVGDRIVFVTADGRQRYTALENLCLERVARAIADTPERLQWSVTGVVTEYRSANYVLLRRAVMKGAIEAH